MKSDRAARSVDRRASLMVSASVLAAASLAGGQAIAQSATSASAGPSTVGEVIVTASKRTEAISKLPFNISAYSSKQLERANISSVAELSQAVPNFVVQDGGLRSTATTIPIIRGLNASQPSVTSARYFQTPVGFYLGNAPITGSIPIEDLDRVEVLRGPQGTLYGAGALAGAVRFLPAQPKLGVFSAEIEGSMSNVAHSSSWSSDVAGMVNIPIGQDLALRIVGKREYEAGFIDQHDIMKRVGDNYVSGAPVLANPADVAGSEAVYFNKKDVNYAYSTSARASLLWKPNDRVSVEAAFNYAYQNGDGSPTDNPSYAGGASPIDQRVTLAATGKYERSLPMLEPFSRESELATLDGSYDLGFATLSGTVAWGKTDGRVASDQTVALLGTPYGYYYTGIPADPRTVIPVTNEDFEDSVTEEVRLVSKEGGRFDYIVGAFLQQDRRHIGLEVWDPGADAQSAAANGGSTVPIVLGGTYVPLYANGLSYTQQAKQQFHDYSVYGDLTWHVNDAWQVTGGFRAFYQTFNQSLYENASFFEPAGIFPVSQTISNSLSSAIGKINSSYKFSPSSQVYFTWSQGFRRGGANAFATAGAVEEPTSLIGYKPDKTNNYEIGVKGTYRGLYYNLDVFYIDWSAPQIDLLTPFNLTAVVVNANGADSKGAEFELSGPIGPKGLSFNLGLAYAAARLTKDFRLPSGSGAGSIVPDAIVGKSGDRLPGAPDFSGNINVNYRVELPKDSAVTFTLGADYRGSIVNILPSINPNTPSTTQPGYALMHGSVEFDMNTWEVTLYGTNLTDQRAVLNTTLRTLFSESTLGNWGNSYMITRPREVGLRIKKRF